MMLMKIEVAAIERRIGQLEDTLEPPDLPFPQAARDAWAAARRAVVTAEAQRADAVRRNRAQPSYGPHPEVLAAERDLEAAGRRATARAADLSAATADRQRAFLEAKVGIINSIEPWPDS
jgi:hypothetical protein